MGAFSSAWFWQTELHMTLNIAVFEEFRPSAQQMTGSNLLLFLLFCSHFNLFVCLF